jgi:hypothetical protein
MRVKTALLFAAALTFCLAGLVVAGPETMIAGVVKDSSGRVLAGVRVEAASDALIEKSRAVTTDKAGLYKIVDVRPGTYTVTFTLEGYQTFEREGLEVVSDFVTTANASLKDARVHD